MLPVRYIRSWLQERISQLDPLTRYKRIVHTINIPLSPFGMLYAQYICISVSSWQIDSSIFLRFLRFNQPLLSHYSSNVSLFSLMSNELLFYDKFIFTLTTLHSVRCCATFNGIICRNTTIPTLPSELLFLFRHFFPAFIFTFGIFFPPQFLLLRLLLSNRRCDAVRS